MEGMLFVKFSAQPVCPFPFGDGDDDDDSDTDIYWTGMARGTLSFVISMHFFFHLIFLTTLRVLLWKNDTLK